jgi:outer membrane cobalamin receptor
LYVTLSLLEAKLKSPKIIFVILIILTVVNTGQETGVTISGLISDATTGEALIGTNLLLYKDKVDTDNPPFRGTSTNRYGFYAFPRILKGKYILIARNIGYKTLAIELNVTITEGTLQNNIKLVSEDVELEEIVIKGERDDEILISKIDISTETLKQLPSLSGEVDIFKSLQLLPGIQVASELSTGLYIRGGSPDQTLTLVDGMILYNPAHLGNFTSTFNSNATQDIRLIKGAFPAEYGGRLSSVLDIKLRSGTREKDKGELGIGTVNSFVNLEGPLTGNASYMLAGRAMYYDALRKTFNSNSNAPLYNYYDFNGKFTYALSESDIISVSGFFSKDNLYNDTEDNLSYDIDWQNGAVNLNWHKVSPKGHFSNTTLSYVNYRFKTILDDNLELVTGNDYFSDSKLNDFYLKKSFDYYWHENHSIKTGAEVTLHSYNLIASNFFDYSLEKDSEFRETKLSKEFSLYFQNESNFNEIFRANLGVRFYYFDQNSRLKFEPRISFSYAIANDLFVNSAFSVANQFLHLIVRDDKTMPTDLWYPSTKEVEPANSTQYVLGFDKYFNDRRYLLQIEAYYRDMKNIYEFKENPDLTIGEPLEDQFTKGEGEAYGVEMFFNKRAGQLTGWVGYTLSWTRRVFSELNNGRLFYPRYDRRHDISIVLSYELTKQISFGATWSYATGQGFTLPNGWFQFNDVALSDDSNILLNFTGRNEFKSDDYHKLDLNFRYKFSDSDNSSEFYINLHNVYNRANTFAQYVELNQATGTDDNELLNAEMKKLTLFPFIPTAGIKIKF